MSTFDEASRVWAAASGFAAELHPLWTVNGNPHGGYLMAILANAAIAAVKGRHPHPLASSAMYLAPPQAGPATISVEPLRQGRSASQVRARLSQDGTPKVDALFTLGLLQSSQTTWFDAPPVEVAPFEECLRSPVKVPGTSVTVAMLDEVDQRIDIARVGEGNPTAHGTIAGGAGEMRGWLAFADGTPFDPVSLLYAADAFPPATFTLGSIGWVPTLELTVYVRAVPAAGPLRVRQRVRALTGSVVDQVCEIWDATDQVVAQASQLALVRLAG